MIPNFKYAAQHLTIHFSSISIGKDIFNYVIDIGFLQ